MDLLILRTLVFGSEQGQSITRAIQQQSDDTLLVDHGSLHPALQCREARGWIKAEWDTSENNRRGEGGRLNSAQVFLSRQKHVRRGRVAPTQVVVRKWT